MNTASSGATVFAPALWSTVRGSWSNKRINNGKADLAVKELVVKPGDTIDFVVDCVKDYENDEFTWTPAIKVKTENEPANALAWDAAKDFAGPAPLSLPAREVRAGASRSRMNLRLWISSFTDRK